MKKLLSLTIVATTMTFCSKEANKKETKVTNKAAISIKASTMFVTVDKEPLLAYATEDNALETEVSDSNIVARELYRSALKYNFKLPGWPKNTEGTQAKTILKDGKASDGNFYNIDRVTSSGATTQRPEIAAKIVSRWKKLGIEIGFIQTNPETTSEITNGRKLYDAVGEGGYNGKLVLVGKNTSHVDLGNDKKGSAWSEKKNVATFSFSEIVTAYNTGYLTQSQFGKIKLKDGTVEIRSVGYIVASVKHDDKKTNVKNMKKANAFRQGVLDAVKEQNTGTASFVNKSESGEKTSDKTLQFDATDIKKHFEKLVKSAKYIDQDRSIAYYAGGDASENSLVADQLFKVKATNTKGHFLVVEKGGTHSVKDPDTKKLSDEIPKGFGEGSDAKWSLGAGQNKVSTRVYMATKPWVKTRVEGDKADKDNDIYSSWAAIEQYSNALAIEAVLSSLYGQNFGKVKYFGKHTYIGGFPSFTRVGTNGVEKDEHKIDVHLLQKVRKELFAKNINVADIDDEFLGSGL